jgi:Xaa-Pro aminopeptidase
MIVSNEPGYYEDGNFGIRIENLVTVVEKESLKEYKGRGFLGFENLTHIPIQKKLIKVELLMDEELQWLNDYHVQVRDKVMPLIKNERTKLWLIENTSIIVK